MKTAKTSINRQPRARLTRQALASGAVIAGMAALAACSSVPQRNAALELAGERYVTAQSQAAVTTLASEEMKRAGEALALANQAQNSGEPTATVDHLAYLASQRVSIAQETANNRSAQAVIAGAATERDRMLLAQRTQEADTAQRKLAQADITAAADKARRDAQVGDLQAQLAELNARQTERGMVVTLGDVLFDSGRAQLEGRSAPTINKLAEFLKRNPQRSASIEGHTDSQGGTEANQDLAGRRAVTVKDALLQQGVPGERLSTRSLGETSPVADNSTVVGRQMNRRVEVIFSAAAGDVVTR